MPTRRTERRLAAVFALLTLAAMFPAVALGHAELATARPADKATVTGSPPEIVFTFTEPVVPSKSSLKLVDTGGHIVADGSTVDPTDAKTIHLVVAPQPPGAYTVRWTTASALDGDIAHGTTTFTIVAASPSPSVAPTTSVPPSVAASPAASSSAGASSPSVSAAPSGGTGTPASTGDAVIPVIAALLILAALGLWLLRSRSRRVG
jgi:methionine-rich copper-binding protein CopC